MANLKILRSSIAVLAVTFLLSAPALGWVVATKSASGSVTTYECAYFSGSYVLKVDGVAVSPFPNGFPNPACVDLMLKFMSIPEKWVIKNSSSRSKRNGSMPSAFVFFSITLVSGLQCRSRLIPSKPVSRTSFTGRDAFITSYSTCSDSKGSGQR